MYNQSGIKAVSGVPELLKKTETGLPHYEVYIMTAKEKWLYILIAAVAVFLIGLVFFSGFAFFDMEIRMHKRAVTLKYMNILLASALMPLALKYPAIKTKELIEKRKKELNIQFKDMLYALASSLSAGRSVESAFKEVPKDLSILYPDPDTLIIKEVEYMVRKIEMNETVEAAISDLADRSGLEDVRNFADVFYTCKRSGGNMVQIIRNTSNIIGEKIELTQEIQTILSARNFERRVMNILPVFMILTLSLSSGDYIEPVFVTAAGKIVMLAALVLLTAAHFISKRIMDISV